MSKTSLSPTFFILASLLLFCSCATAPDKPVTIREFSALGIERNFDFDYTSEHLLKHLNKKGVVVFEAKKKGGEQKPYYIKIWATPGGPVAEIYAIE